MSPAALGCWPSIRYIRACSQLNEALGLRIPFRVIRVVRQRLDRRSAEFADMSSSHVESTALEFPNVCCCTESDEVGQLRIAERVTLPPELSGVG